jgi:hypothetical protein
MTRQALLLQDLRDTNGWTDEGSNQAMNRRASNPALCLAALLMAASGAASQADDARPVAIQAASASARA